MAGIVSGVAGLAVGAGFQPVNPQYAYSAPSPAPPPAGYGSQYHTNPGTQTLQGDLKQDGTFKGHGTGAKIQGGFDASGDIS